MSDAIMFAATIAMIRDLLEIERTRIEVVLADPEANPRERHPAWTTDGTCDDLNCTIATHPEHWREGESDRFVLLEGLENLIETLGRYEQRLHDTIPD